MANSLFLVIAPGDQSDAPAFEIVDDGSGNTSLKLDNTTMYLAAVDLSTLAATAAEINGAADVSARYIATGDVTTYSVATTDSGKVINIGTLSTDCAITLPTASAGLEYTFVSAAITDQAAVITIAADTTAGVFAGGVMHADSDSTTVGSVVPDGTDYSIVITNPQAGTSVKFVSDGTGWILSGFVLAAAAPTYA